MNADGTGQQYIRSFKIENGDPIPNDNSAGTDDITWSPNGQEILFCDDGDRAIWAVDLATGEYRSVLDLGGDDVTISPVRKQIAFMRASDIWTVSFDDTSGRVVIDPSTLTRLHTDGYDLRQMYPAWSPDGSQLAFRIRETDALVVRDMDSGVETVIHTGRFNEPVWSPDGLEIGYAGARPVRNGDTYDLFRIAADGSSIPRRGMIPNSPPAVIKASRTEWTC